ncbi:MAG: RecX family transcriptional regulator [Clostridia bacterium]|nr:RecX family transcriptional regulator [Clostridia bacterium]
MNTYTIQSVFRSLAGVSVSVLIRTKKGEEETAEFLISDDLWTFRHLAAGDPITSDTFAEMEHAALFSRALARTKEVLSYSGHSKNGLIAKLRHHGLPEEICKEAADWAVEKRLIREDEQASMLADTYHKRKYWGRKRIYAELTARGYTSETVQSALSAITDEDYLRALSVIIRNKYTPLPEDPAEKQKMVLSLLRLGYTGQEIKDAIAQAEEER